MRVLYLLGVCLNAWCVSFQLTTLSTRPDMVTGGSVLLRLAVVEGLDGRPLSSVASVKRNGTEVTPAFRVSAVPHAFDALVSGLKPGLNTIEVFQPEATAPAASLQVRNYPITGPVFSGLHEQPFICETATFRLPDGSALGAPLDNHCSAPTNVTYLYRSNAADAPTALKPLPLSGDLPGDVATTTTSTGLTVPYIVRVETGTINRAIYQIAVLHDPSVLPSPFVVNERWNRRLLYSFGGGCTEGWYRQGNSTALGLNNVSRGSLADSVLGSGYAYASASLNVFGNNCQDVTAAETMMMVKEHFIETFGTPLFTFGRGGSGGAYQQVQIADNYPGLLDGIIPSATFPDVLATIQYLTDAQLLSAYFTKIADKLTDVQKLAIGGTGVLNSVTRVSSGAGRINPRVFCPPVLPLSMRYHPQTNPSGARCDVFDHTVNVYGRDHGTGFARRPLDNTGVQYGLAALNQGVITPAQFLDLNELIGGYDNDGNIVGTRSIADTQALRAAYSTGRVTRGGNGLGRIPILDLRGYLDLNSGGDLHMKYHSFGLRERIQLANGTTANHVLLVTHSAHPKIEELTIWKMDEWLTALSADRSTDTVADRITRAKPLDLVDACYSPAGERIVEPQSFAGGKCNEFYPTFKSPRMVAGGPLTNDVLKCQLKPVDAGDYGVNFTEVEKLRLTTIFRDGVCDWTKKGVGQVAITSTWQTF